jgi:(1->4)-alpha-D-glucan 1-alpha-D-glucosylmutase
MMPPRSTIRLQLHRGFTFDNAAALAPYFATLGVSHLYLSPILTARAGSMHGYDVVDPTRVNPELGGEEALRRLVQAARRNGLGIILDIVPNHMAIGSNNRWWMDVLARGRKSRFAKYFDIDWTPDNPHLRGKVALPILSRPYGQALAAGEITVRCDKNGPALVRYFDHSLPLAAASDPTLAQPPYRDFDPASAEGRERLSKLLDSQHYRLMWWRSANDEINWRRFFDINELAAIRVEDDEVFEAVHGMILRLYADGLIDGLRIDHVDGLARPGAYCRKLRQRLLSLERERPDDCPKGPAYLVVEKILSHDETLPKGWEIDGTTGYDFMDEISSLQHDANGEHTLEKLWERASGRSADFAIEEKLARRQILQRSFAAQHEAAAQALYEIAQADLSTRDFSRRAIGRCLTEILTHFPAYRTYAEVSQASPADNAFLSRALADAKTTCLPSDRWLVDILGNWLSGKRIRPATDTLQVVAMRRFQQLSAPLCAKAVEDTAFYRYGRLISRNDVGFDARLFSCSIPEFHERMLARATGLPLDMLATATHDHKRGEDVRARLAVLSELAGEWSHAVKRWLRLAASRLREVDGIRMPHEGDLAILFQTIVGAWPHELATNDEPGLAAYSARLTAWQQKALREAKLWSDWSEPNEVYESAAINFIQFLFAEPFDLLNEIAAFAHRVAAAGAANSLAQTLIKFTAPGVPDIYQGTEYWDLSLVDPDNRAPVDFAARQNTLDDTFPAELAASWRDGCIKQSTIARILAARKTAPKLFSKGSYVPLETIGPLAAHIVAFARVFDGGFAITAASRLCVRLLSDESSLAPPPERWQSTGIVTPTFLRNAVCFSPLHRSRKIHLDAILAASEIFEDLPIAFLMGGNDSQKNLM